MNQMVFEYLHDFAGQGVCWYSIIIFCAKYLAYIMVAALVFFLILGKDKKRELKMIFYTIASAVLARLIITELIRYFYHHSRPFEVFNFIPLIYDYAGSFPSGHAAFFFALSTAIFIFHRKWGIVYFLGSFIIVLSRIMAGIHWPLDILGGMTIGIGSTILLASFTIWRQKRQIVITKQ